MGVTAWARGTPATARRGGPGEQARPGLGAHGRAGGAWVIVLGLAVFQMGSQVAAEAAGVKRVRGFAAPEEQPVTAELIAAQTSIQPGGTTQIGVLFRMEEGWHIYAEEPGEAGLATSVSWSVPASVSVGPLQWPPPQAFVEPGDIRTFGYEGAVVLPSLLRLAREADPRGTLPITAEVSWLACRDICIPGSATLTLVLPISPHPPAPSAHAEWFPS